MQIKVEIYTAAEDAAWNKMLQLLGEKDWFIPVNWVNLSAYDNIEQLLADIEQPYTSVELLAQIDKDITDVADIASVANRCFDHPCDKVLFVGAAGYEYHFYAIKL